MADHETNINQFAGVNALAKRIEELTKQRDELTKERQDSQTRLLEEHGVALASLERSVALLVDRIKDLGEMSKRITRLESWKVYLAGIASAFTFIGTLIGGALYATDSISGGAAYRGHTESKLASHSERCSGHRERCAPVDNPGDLKATSLWPNG